jgi:hypothetical protein
LGSFFIDELYGVRVKSGCAFKNEFGEELTWADGETFALGGQELVGVCVEEDVETGGGAFFASHGERYLIGCYQKE